MLIVISRKTQIGKNIKPRWNKLVFDNDDRFAHFYG